MCSVKDERRTCSKSSQKLHCRQGSKYTFTSTCNNHQLQPSIPAGKPGQVNLQEVDEQASALAVLPRGKRHNTVGFYSKLVRIAVEGILEGRVDSSCDTLDSGGDVGGHRDVGKHTGVLPLSTCWPLVEQVFRYLAEQVGTC